MWSNGPRLDALRVYLLFAALLLAYGLVNLWAGGQLVGKKYGGFLWIHDLSRQPPYYVAPLPWRTLYISDDTLHFVDTLVQINGQPLETAAAVYAAHRPGDPIAYLVRRDGKLITITEPLRIFTLEMFLLIHGMLFLVGASAIGSGFALLRSPRRPYLTAIAFGLLFAAGAALYFVGEYTHLTPTVTASRLPWLLLGAPAAAMIGGLFLIAALLYPEPSPFLQRFPYFPWLLLSLPFPAVLALAIISQLGWRDASEVLLRGLHAYGAICFLALWFVGVATYRRLRQARRSQELQAMRTLVMAAFWLSVAMLLLWLGPFVLTGRPILPYEVLAAFLAVLPIVLVYSLHNGETVRLLVEEAAISRTQAEQINLLRRSRDRSLHEVADRLHDYVLPELRGSHLLAAQMQRRSSGLPAASQENLFTMAAGLQSALAHVQRLIDGAKPVDWSAISLQTALDQLVERYRRRSETPAIQFDAAYDEADEEAVKDVFFTVAQLALDNAVRHAEAQTVTLTLRSVAGVVTLTIYDDGSGFDQEQVILHQDDRRHLGLTNMRLRAEEIGAQLVITNEPQQGTYIQLSWKRPLVVHDRRLSSPAGE